MALIACIPFIHLAVGIMLIFGGMAESRPGEPSPVFIGAIFVAVASLIILFGWTLAICTMLAGRYLGQRTRYRFCFAVAIVSCLWMPVGTLLGVFTILVLNRPTVKRLFGVA